WRMTVGDTSVIAELIRSVMLAPAGPGEVVALDGGGTIGFCRTAQGANVGGAHCDRADAIRLADDLLEAHHDARRHLKAPVAKSLKANASDLQETIKQTVEAFRSN